MSNGIVEIAFMFIELPTQTHYFGELIPAVNRWGSLSNLVSPHFSIPVLPWFLRKWCSMHVALLLFGVAKLAQKQNLCVEFMHCKFEQCHICLCFSMSMVETWKSYSKMRTENCPGRSSFSWPVTLRLAWSICIVKVLSIGTWLPRWVFKLVSCHADEKNVCIRCP